MKRIILFFSVLIFASELSAQEFEKSFDNSTLRLDYIFSGNNKMQNIALSKLKQTVNWYGRKNNLTKSLLDGNGRITLKDSASDNVIYVNTFSSLFQEWVLTQEAVNVNRAFENTFLVPFPKHTVKIEISLFDSHGNVCAKTDHFVNPKDALIEKHSEIAATPYKYISKGADKNCIDVVFVAEGYTKEEMSIFSQDVNNSVQSLLNNEPFKSNRNKFNFIEVDCLSKDSGVSVPQNGVWKRTALGSHFNTFYSDRYLTTPNVFDLHDILINIPYEHIIILANTDVYGGGGIFNSYTLTTAHNFEFTSVVVHEFGHSFAGLADEYFYDDQYEEMYYSDIEPWEPNITTMADFSKKWKDMLPAGFKVPSPAPQNESLLQQCTKIGVFEGGGYMSKGVYRPAYQCRMKINEAPVFCPVCQRAIKKMIDFY